MPAHPKPQPRAKKPGAMKTKPKVPKKPTEAAQVVPVSTLPPKAPKAPKATKAPPKPKKAPSAKPAAPTGTSKSDMLMGMLQRPGGASSKDMEAATGWAPHSVRGFLGTLRKRGVVVVSKKYGKGEATVYSVETPAAEPVGDVV